MKHGEAPPAAHVAPDDPDLANVNGDLDRYLVMERLLEPDGLDDCNKEGT